MAQSVVNIRMDEDLKKEMEQTCQLLGMNMTTAITIFAKKMSREKRIPFEVSYYDTSIDVVMAEAREAAERIWEKSVENGTAEMTLDDINAEIAAARSERKARKAVK